MLDKSIRLTELYLKNYAPFYESMGLKEFHFDRTNSKNDLVLVLGGNGSGKTYLLSELTPEPVEHIAGRISNRFIENLEGEKRLTYCVNDKVFFTCRILFSADRKKTSCFMTMKDESGKETELNPNGNVSSYMDMCKLYLGYDKTYKNIGFISKDVKNVVTMSYNDRHQLMSMWLPDTGGFLTAAKNAMKKKNQAQKEIDGLLKDMADISLSTYTDKINLSKLELEKREASLKKIRDAISKGSVFISSLEKYTASDLKSLLADFKTKLSDYETRLLKNKQLFDKYINGDVQTCKNNISEEIKNNESQKSFLEAKLGSINELISAEILTTEKLQGEINASSSSNNGMSMISVSESINRLNTDIESSSNMIAEAIKKHEYYNTVELSSELKDAIKSVMATLTTICAITGNIETFCNGYTISDLLKSGESGIASKLDSKIESLKSTNESIKKSISDMEESIIEIESSRIDPSIIKFAPSKCSQTTCKLIAELMSRTSVDTRVASIRQNIILKKNEISINESDIEKTIIDINNIKNSFANISKITDALMSINEKIVYLPKDIVDKINSSDPSYVIENTDKILSELKELDEYVSVQERLKTAKDSLFNLRNISKLLEVKDKTSAELKISISNQEEYKRRRNCIVDNLKQATDNLVKLNDISNSVESLSAEKTYLRDAYRELSSTKSFLSVYNDRLYNKRVIQQCVSSLKAKELDLDTSISSLKADIEKWNSLLTSRATLEERKNNLEVKRNIYDLAYSVWNAKTGYPSMIIKDFLNEVQYIANKNLDEIWGGVIRLEQFQINENEFSIPVKRGNVLLHDVTECSTAEQSTIALILSFAIIEVSSENSLYNIVRIDEADAGFDETRRQTFLSTVLGRMKQINCRNAYVVTHNNAFDNVTCDVILLKGYEKIISIGALDNKNIIYSFDKTGI